MKMASENETVTDIIKREIEMSDMYFCGYDPEEALVAQCSTCKFFKKKHSYCTLNDSLTNAKYKCSRWKFKTNKECADEYKNEINREFEKLRAENTLLRAALKVAEDALQNLQERLVASIHDGTINPHEALKIAEDAIAAIRKERDM